ncbi:MAG: tryptophan synthase subunit alpha [Azoarcus sp.]|jgi:tryptophan synthase alpha chain|nr:tryptophan synthase subunit alpha [Azoarcus sp.]
MSRIQTTFQRLQIEGRKALIPFIVAGDPDGELTVPLMRSLVAGGADIIELGVPFSDPMADGPVIQRASERALTKGMSLARVLDIVRAFRTEDVVTPVVLMGYANPVEAMGVAIFPDAARKAGVDGVLVVDYPPEECVAFTASIRAAGLDQIFLLAPNSSGQRFHDIAQASSGFLYYVSFKGVTGASHLDFDEIARRIPLIRTAAGMPVGVGFGIRDAEIAKKIGAVADAVVIGSRIVEEIETSPREQACAKVETFVREIRVKLDELAGARS